MLVWEREGVQVMWPRWLHFQLCPPTRITAGCLSYNACHHDACCQVINPPRLPTSMTEYTLSHESQATEPLESPRDDDSLDGIETPKSPETRSHSTTDYTSDEPPPKPNAAEPQEELREEKQCRICLDGVEAESELGRLIRPCLCKGSISVGAHINRLFTTVLGLTFMFL